MVGLRVVPFSLAGILGSKEGSITFVNFETQEDFVMIKLKFAVTKMELVAGTSFKYLLISTFDGGYWKALLEQEVGKGQFEILFTHYFHEAFFPVCLSNFNQVPLLNGIMTRVVLPQRPAESTGSTCCVLRGVGFQQA